LTDPVSKFIPAFSKTKVSTTSDASGKTGNLVEPKRAISIRDMLTHTAGLANSYVGNKEAYRKAMYVPRPRSNAEQIADWLNYLSITILENSGSTLMQLTL